MLKEIFCIFVILDDSFSSLVHFDNSCIVDRHAACAM